MFSRISQLGKNLSEEFESVVNAANRPPNANGTSGAGNRDGAKQQRKDSGSMTSAFETLKSNANILNQSTPEPGALEVVFTSAQGSDHDDRESNEAQEAKEGAENSDDHEANTTGDSVDAKDPGGTNDSKAEPKANELKSIGNPDPKPNESKAKSEPSQPEIPISKEISSKLRKFRKYEEKYPGTCKIGEIFPLPRP